MASDDARTLLGRLAGSGAHGNGHDPSPSTGYCETIECASAALDDLETAGQFVDDIGLKRLENAVEHAEVDLSDCAPEGRDALRAYRAFQDAADGLTDGSRDGPPATE